MKTTIYTLFVGVFALMVSATAWADDVTINTVNIAGSACNLTVIRVAKVAPHKVTITFPTGSGWAPMVVTGNYFSWTDDGTKFGQAIKTSQTGGGGGGGGGKLHRPTQVQPIVMTDRADGNGVDLSWDLINNYPGTAWGVQGRFFIDQDGWHGWRQGLFFIDENGATRQFLPDGAFAPVGLTLEFSNTTSGALAIFVIPIPFLSGTIVFYGNETNGYFPSSANDVSIGGWSLIGPHAPPTNPQLLKNQP